MRRALTILALLLIPATVSADPGVSVDYRDGLLRVTLSGSYPGAWYRVWRSGEFAGSYEAMTSQYGLCTGDCFAVDLEAEPGRTYWYRFEILDPAAGLVEYGPFAVRVPAAPLAIRAWPNPARGIQTLELTLPGRSADPALPVRARILDLQGRVLRELHSGPLARGVTRWSWDGLDAGRSPARSGRYLLAVESPLGRRVTALVRLR